MSSILSKYFPIYSVVCASEPMVNISPPSSLYLLIISGCGLGNVSPHRSPPEFTSIPFPLYIRVLRISSIISPKAEYE